MTPEEYKQYQKEYYKNNKEKIKEYHKKYYKDNKDKILNTKAKKYKSNKYFIHYLDLMEEHSYQLEKHFKEILDNLGDSLPLENKNNLISLFYNFKGLKYNIDTLKNII